MSSEKKAETDYYCHEMSFFNNEKECDITFKVDSQTIFANKWLLRMKSDVFDAMFSSKFKESNDEIIEILDMKYEAFKATIRYMYCNKLVLSDGSDHTLAMDVYRCGHKYNLISLMHCSEKMLIKMITFDTIEDMYLLARDYNLQKLRQCLDDFLKTNLDYYSRKNADELKRISVLSDCHLMSLLIVEKDNEINRLEKLVSELAKHCDQCRNRITFSPLNKI
ncbi:unnamed protein product [Medioppia subpectinata]|uniref:BTB domain-containing protein n=1 Tax=Medioppia subpectinata TaxID=1979941 RepID=A0A7R9LCH3_9ACAR|nr:unnamed protein product [Medioppia subpectinata]CAG2117616.1 unnamed protein product [Medioppia subpectinata]